MPEQKWMPSQALLDTLCDIVGTENVSVGEPMAAHVTFRIGGPRRSWCRLSRPNRLPRWFAHAVLPKPRCASLAWEAICLLPMGVSHAS